MFGELPTKLSVNGQEHEIRADFRNIIRIIIAFNCDELTSREKAYVCLKRLYVDADSLRSEDVEEAYKAAIKFMECNSTHERVKSPRLVNWEKDEQIIFPAINDAAKTEVRLLPFLHWWTFMGYFQSIDYESLFGCVLTIRDKRARGKKMEKYEKEFLHANAELCRLDNGEHIEKSTQNALEDIFKSLVEDGGE